MVMPQAFRVFELHALSGPLSLRCFLMRRTISVLRFPLFALAMGLFLILAGCDSSGPVIEPEPKSEQKDASPPRPLDDAFRTDWKDYHALKVGNIWEYERASSNGAKTRWRKTVLREANLNHQSGFEILYESGTLEGEKPFSYVQFVGYFEPEHRLSDGSGGCGSGSGCSLSDTARVEIGDDVVSGSLLYQDVFVYFSSDTSRVNHFLKGVGLVKTYHRGQQTEAKLVYARIDGKEWGTSKPPFTTMEAESWRKYVPLSVGNTWEYKANTGYCTGGGITTWRFEVAIVADSTAADGSLLYEARTRGGEGESAWVRSEWVLYDSIQRTVVGLDGQRYEDSGAPFGPCGDCEGTKIEFENGDRMEKSGYDDELAVFRENVGRTKYFLAIYVTEFELDYWKIDGVETGTSLPLSRTHDDC